jgi:PAS domain S-box-containing protein
MPGGRKLRGTRRAAAPKRAPRAGAERRQLEASLREALEQQTATSEILRVISRSPADPLLVFDAIVQHAARLCDAEFSAVARGVDGQLHLAALSNLSPEEAAVFRGLFPRPPEHGFVMGRAFVDGRAVHVEDVLADPEYDRRTQGALLRVTGYRTFLGVPIRRGAVPIGVIGCARRAVRAFTPAQIALVETFAEQAVIAIENARLFAEIDARNRELGVALEQQTATSELLKVVGRSTFDLQPVFESLAENAVRLCAAERAFIWRPDGAVLRAVVTHNATADLREFARRHPITPGPGSGAARAALERRTVHIPDALADPAYTFGVREVDPIRTVLAIPMLKADELLGVIAIYRLEVRPFTDGQIALMETFADQAAIAIENVRLFTEVQARNQELTETLEQQTAASEILGVISRSPTDVRPVFDTIASNARRLCRADSGAVFTYDGHLIHLQSLDNTSPEGSAALRRVYPMEATAATAGGRAVLTAAPVHIPDVRDDHRYALPAVQGAGLRSVLSVPMLREGTPVGVIVVHTWETPRPFTSKQIDLLRIFAAQAVIAIQNVHLFTQLEARNLELTEALEQQTATGEILRVISSSPTDAQPVFDTIAQSAARLCDGTVCQVFRFDGERLHFVAGHGHTPEAREATRRAFSIPPNRGSAAGRSILDAVVAHIPDIDADPDFTLGPVARLVTFRSIVAVPMIREGRPIGAIAVGRAQTGHFSDRQIEVLKTFADQAVIAIENVRLFTALEARNRDLTDALEQQTATGEVLRVISGSPTDVQPVFDAIVRSAVRLCDARFALVYRLDGDVIQFVAHHNLPAEAVAEFQRTFPQRLSESPTLVAQAIMRGEVVNVPDIAAQSRVSDAVRALARSSGYRSVLAVPIMREGHALGAIAIARSASSGEPDPFSTEEIPLLRTFSEQAGIAIENVRLFNELEARTAQLTRSIGELQALGEVSHAVSSTLDLETVLATIVSRAVQLSGSYGGIVYEFDDVSQSFRARATHQIAPEYLAAVRAAPIRLGEGAVGRAAVVRAPVEVPDIGAEVELVARQARTILVRQGMRSLLAVPLVREDRLLGGLVILRRERGAFSPEVVATLQTFATQSVLAIHNARLFREIQRQKQYADALVETSPVAIVTMDLAGTVAGWNPGAERLFGYPQGEALGRRMEDLVATPDLREEVRANIRQTLDGEWIRTIARRARKDGTMVDVEISSMPVILDGAKVGMIGIYHDITELLRARREAEGANEAKSAFLATMSHEIRTPMNAVIGMSGLLLNTRLTGEQREYAEVIRQSGDALLTVINDILDFSKIEAGRLELEAQPFDLRECVEGALDLVATQAAEKGLDLAYLLGDGTPAAVVGDVTRLRQVLLNLLSNAVKFTEAGEVVLSVTAHRPNDAAGFHELTFAVRDTGIGIPPERLGRLFQSFSQVDASTTRRYGGTGLGLAISQRLIELMGGRITVTSELEAGSEFRFTIRADPAPAPLPTRRDWSGVQPSLRGKRVLVVDDNATNRRILASYLSAWGMPARDTGSPAEALAWIRADERFDVAILDMHMPGMDGALLAEAMRQEPAGATLPLVLFTSLGRREALAGRDIFAAYLHKPIKPSQLFDALVSVLAEQPVHVAPRATTRGELDPEMARRHPLRILLAEDNVVNQKLALRLLAQMGYRADLAANGLEAIEAVARQTYDVILMDVQMPELDGLEASREINRRWPAPGRPRIVAMTANAMQGDRELCETAGMDDYVAKPIRVEELVAALDRSGPRRQPAPPEGPAGPPESVGAPVAAAIDRAALDRLTASMGGAFVAELIDTFAEDAHALIAALRRALPASALDDFRRASHSLKSTSESLGATRLATLARELEMSARAGSLDGAEGRLRQITEEYELVARALGDLRRDLSA